MSIKDINGGLVGGGVCFPLPLISEESSYDSEFQVSIWFPIGQYVNSFYVIEMHILHKCIFTSSDKVDLLIIHDNLIIHPHSTSDVGC